MNGRLAQPSARLETAAGAPVSDPAGGEQCLRNAPDRRSDLHHASPIDGSIEMRCPVRQPTPSTLRSMDLRIALSTNKYSIGVSLMCMKRILLVSFLSLATSLTGAEKPYDFRASDAYRQLSTADRGRLEQVQRDFVLLWGALDMYADGHDGDLPETLDELVPRYLAELPSDPFATRETASVQTTSITRSKDGMGYGLRKGAPGNRAWVISSVGLADFPYLAERGNVGLYVCKGTWISGWNPAVAK